MLLHNFIKDDRDADNDRQNELNWRPPEDPTGNGERPFPLVTDNNEVLQGGRPSNVQEGNRLRGEVIRRSIPTFLQMHGLRRPMYNGMRYNQYGHVFFDGV